jgi:hypothetical protein
MPTGVYFPESAEVLQEADFAVASNCCPCQTLGTAQPVEKVEWLSVQI